MSKSHILAPIIFGLCKTEITSGTLKFSSIAKSINLSANVLEKHSLHSTKTFLSTIGRKSPSPWQTYLEGYYIFLGKCDYWYDWNSATLHVYTPTMLYLISCYYCSWHSKEYVLCPEVEVFEFGTMYQGIPCLFMIPGWSAEGRWTRDYRTWSRRRDHSLR